MTQLMTVPQVWNDKLSQIRVFFVVDDFKWVVGKKMLWNARKVLIWRRKKVSCDEVNDDDGFWKA